MSLLQQDDYQGFFDAAPVPLLVESPNGTIVAVNAAWLRTFGYRREDVCGCSRDRFLFLAGHPAGGRVRCSDGGDRDVRWQRTRHAAGCDVVAFWPEPPTPAADATPPLLLQDVVRDLLNDIPEGILHVGADRRILWVNHSIETRLGFSVTYLVGERACDVWCERPGGCSDCPLERSQKSGQTEIRRVPLAEGRVMELRVFPLLHAGQPSSLVLVAEVTEQMRVQQETIRAAHLASIGELAAGVAHEINNPINGIINYAQLLHDYLQPLAGEEAQVAERIMREGRRISKIVQSLLGFARTSVESRVSTNMIREIEAVLAMTRAQMRKEHIRLEVRLHEDPPPVVINSHQLQQVILNLVHNARYALNQKFSGQADDKLLTLTLAPHRDARAYLRLSVRDEGSGIAEATRARVFEPFFTTKPAGCGTGLGLSICRDIVKEHAGRMSIDSVDGCYTVVHVDLPTGEE